mgnify:CR=1 FL=1
MKTLGIFAKQPKPGHVKTRLAKAIGDAAAAKLADAFLKDTTQRFASIVDRQVLAYTPAHTEAQRYFRSLAPSAGELWPQPAGDLGSRLAAFFETACSAAQFAAVIGADTPTLPVEFIAEAFERLSSCDCVIGPSTDGGYYLLALRQATPSLFENVDWGTEHVLQQTMERASDAQLTVHHLPVWSDVDTIDDLRRLRNELASATDDPANATPRFTIEAIRATQDVINRSLTHSEPD